MKMKKKIKSGFAAAGLLFLLFALLTAAVMTVDVQPVGPSGSRIGLAGINVLIFNLFGENLVLYYITDWIGVIPVLVAFGFAVTGLVQLIKRKSFKRVDAEIIALGAFYLIVIAVYALFEILIVNYRPVIIDGSLEASFPSSHAMITICVMATAVMRFQEIIKNRTLRTASCVISGVIIAIVVVGRFVSGVHWFTDMIGGLLLGSALVMLYYSVTRHINCKLYISTDTNSL